MAIQSRRGNLVDFDPVKMLPGEWAVTLDSKHIYMCFSAGDVRRMASYEEMVENVNSATQDVQAMFTAEVREAIRQAADATETVTGKIGELQVALNSIGDATDRADAAAEAAEQYVMGDISEKIVTFTEAETKEELKSGESLAILLGKIKKWFSGLGTAAFKSVANNLTTATDGAVLDARQGKVLSEGKVDKVDGKGLSTNDYTNEEKARLTDSGWIYPTLGNFQPHNAVTANRLRYRKIGKLVYLTGVITPYVDIPANDTTSLSTIFTLPEGYRPVVTNNQIQNGTSQAIWALRITTEGVCSMYRYRLGASYSIAAAAVMLNVEASWMVD